MPAAEVILVTQNEDIAEASTLIHTCMSIDGANNVLDEISFANIDDDNCRAYRGIITDAKNIPEKFLGCAPYIIVQLPGQEESVVDYTEAHFEKAPMSIDSVRTRIQELLSQELVFDTDSGIRIAGIPTIDDIFIFFGIQLPLTLHIGEQDTDDEFEDRLAQLQNSLSITNEHIKESDTTDSEGSLQNMSKKVILTITPRGACVYTVEGRLLGACITDEAAKIVQNSEVYERVHTGETQMMGDVIDYLVRIESNNQIIASNLHSYGHFITTIDEITNIENKSKVTTQSRQLYISPAISLTSEYVHTNSDSKAVFECVDGTIIIMREKTFTEGAHV